MTYEDIPMRLPFPYNEPSRNFESYTAAAAAIGGDNVRTLLFWDETITPRLLLQILNNLLNISLKSASQGALFFYYLCPTLFF